MRKYQQKIEDQKHKETFRKKILCPSKILVESHCKKKINILTFNAKPLPIQHFIKIGYEFTFE